MGAAASSTFGGSSHPGSSKLRRALVVRAFNTRSSHSTLEEQFRKYASGADADGDALLTAADIKRALKLSDSSHIACMVDRSIPSAERIPLSNLLLWLTEGKVQWSAALSRSPSQRSPEDSSSTTSSCSVQETETHEDQSQPPVIRFVPSSASLSYASVEENPHDSTPKIYAGGRRSAPTPMQAEGVCTTAIVPRRTTAMNVINRKGDFPVWQKKETFVQERIVEYVTIENGSQQRLVEREKNVQQVMHIECRATGEFAHKETTDYQSIEEFNGELVREQSGQEQYIHLKSREDEFEHATSTMPENGGFRAHGEEPPLTGREDAGEGDCSSSIGALSTADAAAFALDGLLEEMGSVQRLPDGDEIERPIELLAPEESEAGIDHWIRSDDQCYGEYDAGATPFEAGNEFDPHDTYAPVHTTSPCFSPLGKESRHAAAAQQGQSPIYG